MKRFGLEFWLVLLNTILLINLLICEAVSLNDMVDETERTRQLFAKYDAFTAQMQQKGYEPTRSVVLNSVETPTPTPTPEPTHASSPAVVYIPATPAVTHTYVLNTNTKVFHETSCSSAAKISPSNKSTSTTTRSELINRGYSPCGVCRP